MSRDSGGTRHVLGSSGMPSPPARTLVRVHASSQPRKPYTPSPSPSSSQSPVSSSNVSPIRRKSSMSRRSRNGTGLRGCVGVRVKRRSGLQGVELLGGNIGHSALHYLQIRCNLPKDVHKLPGSIPQNVHLCITLYEANANTAISDTKSHGPGRSLKTSLASTEKGS